MKILPIESMLGLLESEEGTKFIEKLFEILPKEKRLNDENELFNRINNSFKNSINGESTDELDNEKIINYFKYIYKYERTRLSIITNALFFFKLYDNSSFEKLEQILENNNIKEEIEKDLKKVMEKILSDEEIGFDELKETISFISTLENAYIDSEVIMDLVNESGVLEPAFMTKVIDKMFYSVLNKEALELFDASVSFKQNVEITLLDYFDRISNGEVEEDTLNKLFEKYVEKILFFYMSTDKNDILLSNNILKRLMTLDIKKLDISLLTKLEVDMAKEIYKEDARKRLEYIDDIINNPNYCEDYIRCVVIPKLDKKTIISTLEDEDFTKILTILDSNGIKKDSKGRIMNLLTSSGIMKKINNERTINKRKLKQIDQTDIKELDKYASKAYYLAQEIDEPLALKIIASHIMNDENTVSKPALKVAMISYANNILRKEGINNWKYVFGEIKNKQEKGTTVGQAYLSKSLIGLSLLRFDAFYTDKTAESYLEGILTTLLHETRHVIDDNNVDHNKLSFENSLITKELLLMSDDEEFYHKNYKSLIIEKYAKMTGVIETLKLLSKIDKDKAKEFYTKASVKIRKLNKTLLDSKRKTNEKEDNFFDMVDNLMKNDPTYIEEYSVLKYEYNEDGTRKSIPLIIDSVSDHINNSSDEENKLDAYKYIRGTINIEVLRSNSLTDILEKLVSLSGIKYDDKILNRQLEIYRTELENRFNQIIDLYKEAQKCNIDISKDITSSKEILLKYIDGDEILDKSANKTLKSSLDTLVENGFISSESVSKKSYKYRRKSL